MDVPSEGLEVLGFRWSPDGAALLLLTKDKVCCCYLHEPDMAEDSGMVAAGAVDGEDAGEGDKVQDARVIERQAIDKEAVLMEERSGEGGRAIAA